MEFTEIRYEVKEGEHAAWITLSRPDKRNRLSAPMLEEILAALARARGDAAVRVIVLAGSGGVFSAGGDLTKMGEGAGSPLHVAVRDTLLALHSMDKPVVAVVEGACLAGAVGIVCSCHMALASEDAVFATPEVNVGLWPMMITAPILRAVGRRKALEMFLLGERLSAAEAMRIGIVNRVVPKERLVEETEGIVQALAAKSPKILALGLEAFAACEDLDFARQVQEFEGWLGRVVATEDAKEGMRAFLEKRKPVWKGQ